MKYKLNDQVVIISGGSQGLGKAIAKKYYEDSNSVVIIVSRSEGKLKQAAVDISGADGFSSVDSSGKNSCRLLYHPCDLSDAERVTDMFKLFERKNIEITQSFICAGGAIPKLFTDLSLQEIGTGIDINYKTAAYLAHGSLLHGVKHLVFFSSSAAVYPFIGYGQYAPTKAALRSLIATLRQEHEDVRISCVYAGNFASEGFEEENRTKPDITREIEGASKAISCSECCDKVMRGLSSGYDDITTDFVGWLLLACSMGFNTHDQRYILWPIGWLIAPLMHLLVIPIYMYMCRRDIRNWRKRQKAEGSEQRKEVSKKE